MDLINLKEYWEDRLKQQYDLRGVGYSGLGAPFNNWMYRIRSWVFARQVASLPIDLTQASILDIGSGTGFYIQQWQSIGASQITGLDITDIAVENLRARFPQYDFYRQNIGDITNPLPSSNYNIVSAMDIFFHIVPEAEYVNAIRNVSECLLPGGYFILSENFVKSRVKQAEHQVSRSLQQIEKYLQDAQFEIVFRKPMFYLMNSPIDSESSLFQFAWKCICGILVRMPVAGHLLGALLFPIELLLISMKKESPSTEIMICRKRF